MDKTILCFLVTFFVLGPQISIAEVPEGFRANQVEKGYWKILEENGDLVSQVDSGFGAVGMLTDTLDSNLCGAVSASIGLSSFKKSIGKLANKDQILKEIIDLRPEAINQVELDIADGLFTTVDLNSVIGVYTKMTLPNQSVSFDSKDLLFDSEITELDLSSRIENEFLILKLSMHNGLGDQANHFVIVVARANKNMEIMVADPYLPMKPFRAKVVPSDHLGTPTFDLHFDGNFHNSKRVVLEGVSRTQFIEMPNIN